MDTLTWDFAVWRVSVACGECVSVACERACERGVSVRKRGCERGVSVRVCEGGYLRDV